MLCQECGMEIEANEYHPYAFCVLVKAGIDPLTFVLEAYGQLTADDSGEAAYLAQFEGLDSPQGMAYLEGRQEFDPAF